MAGQAFKLGDTVGLSQSGESGVVFGHAEFLNGTHSYLLVYKAADGRQTEAWWEQDRLTAAGKATAATDKKADPKPAEAAKPAGPKYDVEEVRKAFKDYAAIEGKEAAIALLKDLGADTVSDLDPAKYGEAMEKLGAAKK